MLYDPVTREFKPRESRAPKPQPAEGLAAETAPARPEATEEGRKRRTRRWTDVRRQRRNREMVTWFLFVVVAGSLIWVTVWMWSRWNHGDFRRQDRSPTTRFWQSINE